MTSPMARLQQKKQAAVTTGSAGSTDIPCAMVLTGSCVLAPVSMTLLVTVACEIVFHRLNTSPGVPGPHVFAVRIVSHAMRHI